MKKLWAKIYSDLDTEIKLCHHTNKPNHILNVQILAIFL